MSANDGGSRPLAVRSGYMNKAQKTLRPEPVDEEESQLEDSDKESDNGDFPTHDKMPDQHPATRTTSQLMELMSGDKPYLNLNPHYQRNVVWTRKAMQMLIDSMFKGFFIPPVIFNVTKVHDEHGVLRYKRTCVDGKQRLSSIRDFMSGRFPWKLRGKDWYYTTPVNEDGSAQIGAKNKRVLPEHQKREFSNKHLLCVEYVDLTQTQEIELFQRVQLGKPLTKAETFKASQGPWQELARKFEVDYADIVNLPKQNNRASQFWAVLCCFTQIYECMYPSTANGVPKLKIRIPQVEKLCVDGNSLDKKTESHLRMVFDKFLELVHDDRSLFDSSIYRHTKTFSPIELTAICCLLSQWGEQRPLGTLKGDIRMLRDHLRQAHADLRQSDAHWATVWRYIDDLEGIRGGVNQGTVPIGRTMPRIQPVHHQTPQSTGAKRGRKPVNEDGDDDFRPTATAKPTSGSGRRPRQTAPRVNYDISAFAAGVGTGMAQNKKQAARNDDSSSSSPWDSDSSREHRSRHAKAPVAPMRDGQTARKRALMDLGGNESIARDLEAKKAKMMATRVKQEEA